MWIRFRELWHSKDICLRISLMFLWVWISRCFAQKKILGTLNKITAFDYFYRSKFLIVCLLPAPLPSSHLSSLSFSALNIASPFHLFIREQKLCLLLQPLVKNSNSISFVSLHYWKPRVPLSTFSLHHEWCPRFQMYNYLLKNKLHIWIFWLCWDSILRI